MTTVRKISPLVDETGKKLPQNMSEQFRNVQGGIEHLKIGSERIQEELKKQTKKLDSHTTDLALITKKLTEVAHLQQSHLKLSISLIKSFENHNLLIKTISNRIDSLTKNVEKLSKGKSVSKKPTSKGLGKKD